MKAILGYKIGMTQMYDKTGRRVGATVVYAKPNFIEKGENTQTLIQEKPGKVNKPQSALAQKHGFEKSNIWLKQITDLEPDQDNQITVAAFKEGDILSISGVSKGKGFAGTIKRHNFHRGPVSHGSDNVRQPGSIGNQQPQHVVKGTRMSGHMGNRNTTVKGNKVLAVFPEEHIILVSGAIPGPAKSKVFIKTNG